MCCVVVVVSPSPYESFEHGGIAPMTNTTHPRIVPTAKYTARDDSSQYLQSAHQPFNKASPWLFSAVLSMGLGGLP